MIKTAKKIIRDKGISVIPLRDNKLPMVAYRPFCKRFMNDAEVEHYFKGEVNSMGWICGKLSNLTLLDFDLKYDMTPEGMPDVFERFLAQVPDDLSSRILHVRTRSGGMHLWIRYSDGESNKKLAQRNTTFEEQMDSYWEAFHKSGDKELSEKIARNDKVRVLIETRGEGGYGVSFYDPRYDLVGGELGKISKDEFDYLLSLAKTFDANYKEYKYEDKDLKFSDIFEDFNDKCDFTALMTDYGWTVTGEDSQRVYYLRPGKSDSKLSANFSKDHRVFVCFSTSTVFEANEHIPPHKVFAILAADEDYKKAAKMLKERGYGKF